MPNEPQVAEFRFAIGDAPTHSCLLTIVESLDDPLPEDARQELAIRPLVRRYRQIALRNLHVVDVPFRPYVATGFLKLWNTRHAGRKEHVDVQVSTYPRCRRCVVKLVVPRVRFWPRGGYTFGGLSGVDPGFAKHIRPKAIIVVPPDGMTLQDMPIPLDQSREIGWVVESKEPHHDGVPLRVHFQQSKNGIVMGGSTIIVRPVTKL